jgi:nitrous oxidase accessory protein NosD
VRISNRAATAAIAVAAGALALAAPAAAKPNAKHGNKHVVKPGESIQAAIDAADPGDTVLVKHGSYAESLQINKDGIRLKGQKVTLTQPAQAADTVCNQFAESPSQVTGICVVGDVTIDQSGNPTVNKPVKDVRVTGFTVKGFGGDGVFIFGADGTRLDHSRLLSNGGYGTFSNTSSGTHYVHDVAKGNGAPAFYVGDSPQADATISHVVAKNNHGEGILLRNASHGKVTHVVSSGNCAGILVLADAPGPAGDWRIDHVRALRNNNACAGDPGEGEPAISGIGVGLLGANDVRLNHNVVKGNRDLHESFATGGIVVQKGSGGTEPVNDVVRHNRLKDNSPFDIDWDQTGTVTFKKNTCSTSSPSGLCS